MIVEHFDELRLDEFELLFVHLLELCHQYFVLHLPTPQCHKAVAILRKIALLLFGDPLFIFFVS